MTERELLTQGLEHHHAGRVPEAAERYQQVLRGNPSQPDALYLLGVLAHQIGNAEAAIGLMRRAIAVAGEQPRLHEILGLSLMQLDRLDEAEASLVRAAESGSPESSNNLGILRKKQGRLDDAIGEFARAVERNPSFADALYNLGNAHRARGEYEIAAGFLRRAVGANPAHADAMAALGQTWSAAGQHAEAATVLRKAVEMRPEDAQLRCELAGAFEGMKEFADAAVSYRAALAIDPGRFETKHNLAHALFELGQADEALDLFREAAEGPRAALPRAMIAVMIPGAPKATNEDVLAARRAFAEHDLPPVATRRASLPRRDGPLRIGYVSSFFHRQNWMKPVWALIAHHDRERFELHLFSDAPESAMAEGYRADARDVYHDISGLSNEGAARLIEAQGIDVLVDLNGYSKIGRLGIFAMRPAGAIVGWFNMFATTGMACYDYLIGDDQVIPRDEEASYCEKILRVSGSYLTFEVTYPVPELVDPPCLVSGGVTFGCLAPLYKITPQAIGGWSGILREAPGSSLVLRGSALRSEGARRYVLEAFAAHGVGEGRIRLLGPAGHFEFLETYNQIDIALDTFPYNGGTTTTEAIWQGVPVVSYWGDRWVSRTSASILRGGGLGQFVHGDLEGYAAQAVSLANAPGTPAMLTGLRRNMRERLRGAAVCDTAGFAREMEGMYWNVARAGAKG